MKFSSLPAVAASLALLSSCSTTKSTHSPDKHPQQTLKLPSSKGKVEFKDFVKSTLGKPYVYPAPFDRDSPTQFYNSYDCVTFTLSMLSNCHGVTFQRGRTDSGDKILTDHLKAHTAARLVQGNIETHTLSSGKIKIGDVILVGEPDRASENNFSTTHFLIVLKTEYDGGKLSNIKVMHANSTGKFGQPRQIILDDFKTYMQRRNGNSKFQSALICSPKRKNNLLASN